MEQPDGTDFRTFLKCVIAVSIGLLVYGGYCLFASPRVREQAAHVPSMTCNELIRNGAGNQRYIILTDACLNVEGRSVSECDGETGAMELYHPLYAANLKEEPAPRDLSLLLGITDEMARRRIRDDRKHRQQAGQAGLSPFTGELTRGDKLPRWAREGLVATYPGIAPGKCWVITVSNYEPTPERADRLWWHGVASTVGGTALLLVSLTLRRTSLRITADQRGTAEGVLTTESGKPN